MRQRLHVIPVGPVAPVSALQTVGPAGLPDLVDNPIQRGIRDRHVKWPYRACWGAGGVLCEEYGWKSSDQRAPRNCWQGIGHRITSKSHLLLRGSPSRLPVGCTILIPGF